MAGQGGDRLKTDSACYSETWLATLKASLREFSSLIFLLRALWKADKLISRFKN